MNNQKTRLIETILPFKEIGQEAGKEKFVRKGHISSMHGWWSRKPLIAGRFSIVSSLLDLPADTEQATNMTALVKKICTWEGGQDKFNIEKIKQLIQTQYNNSSYKMLDSFAGGGSIPLEGLRLGCDTYSLDINPVAYIVQLCSLKYPQDYGIKLKKDVEYYGKILHKQVYAKLNKFYIGENNELIEHYLWVRTIKCPNPTCERIVPLLKNMWIYNKKNKKIALNLIDLNPHFKLEITQNIDFDPNKGTISQGNLNCPFCNNVSDVKYVRKEGQAGRLVPYLAVVCYSNKYKGIKKDFRSPTKHDLLVITEAEKEFDKINASSTDLLSFIPDEPAPRKGSGPQRFFSYSNYGFATFDTLFTKRQGLTLGTISSEIHTIYDQILAKENDDEYAKAVITYFALIVDRMADLNCNLTSWRASDGGVRNLFDRPTISMKWGFGEPNPLETGTGSFLGFLNIILDIIEECTKVAKKGANVILGSANNLPFSDNEFDIVSIDPPYYDYIIYSDISDFFYVWLKRSIGSYYPDIFATPLTPKSNEIIHNSHRHGGDIEASKKFYEDNMKKSFEEIRRVLKDDAIGVIMFTHRSTSAWESLLSSIVDAGLMVSASWAIQTEMSSRLQSVGRKGQATVGSTIFLVCRKRPLDAGVGYLQQIRESLTDMINSKLQLFWNNAIVGSDFFISAIGPGMEVFSKYSRIEDYSGNIISVKELLDLIRSITTNYITQQLLKDSSGSKIDNLSQFYLTYRWAYLDTTVEFDEARKLASCFGIDLENYWSTNSTIKKNSTQISVLGPKERKDIKNCDTFVDTMHKAIHLWEKGNKLELEKFLAENPIVNQSSFWQYCQAVAESLVIGSKEKQLIEGFLLSKDKNIKKAIETDKKLRLTDFVQ